MPTLRINGHDKSFKNGNDDQSIVNAVDSTSRSYTGSAEVTALTRTTTTGKTFYITDIQVHLLDGLLLNESGLNWRLYVDGTMTAAGCVGSTAVGVGGIGFGNSNTHFITPVKVDSATDAVIKIYNFDSTATLQISITLLGFEE